MRLVIISTFVLLVASGCGGSKAPQDPGVPAGAALVTDLVRPAGGGGAAPGGADPYELPADGAVYVVDATAGRVLFNGSVTAGDVLKLSWGGVTIDTRLPSKSGSRPRYERQVARYEPGRRYRVYYHPGAAPANPTSDEGSPLTRPFETRERTVDPEGQRRQRPTR